MAALSPIEGTPLPIQNPEHFDKPLSATDVGQTASEQKRKQAITSLAFEGELPVNQGTEGDVADVKAVGTAQREQDLKAQMEAAAIDTSLPEQERIRQIRKLFVDAGQPQGLVSSFIQIIAAQSQTTPRTANRSLAIQENQDAIVAAHREIDALKKGYGLEISPLYQPGDILDSAIIDFGVIAFAPGTFGAQVVDVMNEVMPELVEVSDYFLTGDLIRRWHDALKDMDVHERLIKVRAMKDAINENKFMGTDNDFIDWDLHHTLLDDDDVGLGKELLFDFFSLLDWAIFGSLVRGGVKVTGKVLSKITKNSGDDFAKAVTNPGIRKVEPTVSKTLDQVDPDKSEDLIRRAVADEGGEISKSMGVTRETLTAEHIFPKLNPASIVRPGPDVARAPEFGRIMFSQAEKSAIESNVDSLVKNSSDLDEVKISKSSFELQEGGYKGTYRVAPIGNIGFTSQRAAREAFAGYKEFAEGPGRVLVRNFEIDEFVPLGTMKGKLKGKNNEYMLEFDVSEVYTSKHALAENPVLPKGAGYKAWRAKFLDKASWGKEWFLNAGNQAADQFSRRQRELRDIIKPLNDLRPTQQRLVYEQLEYGDKHQVWLLNSDLMREWAHLPNANELIQGYRAAHQHQDRVWDFLNDGLYRRLAAKDISEIVVQTTEGEMKLLGKAVDDITELPSDVRKIYDPETKGLREITSDELSALKDQNVRYVRLETPLNVDKFEIHFSLLPREAKNIVVNKLPRAVVRYNPGYITRFYDAAYLVRVPYFVRVNGADTATKRFRVLGIESNQKDADELLAQLRNDAGLAGDDPALLERVRADEIKGEGADYYDIFNLQRLSDRGELYTSPRGPERLGKVEGDAITAEGIRRRRVESISESMTAARDSAARAGTLDLTIDKFVANWELMWAKDFGIEGKMPWFGDVPQPPNMNPDLIKKWRDAKGFRDYIKMLSGVDETALKKFIEESAIDIAEGLMHTRGDGWRALLANGVIKNRNSGVLNFVKANAFFQLITMRPARQALLQANQMTLYLGRDGAREYFLGGGGTQDFISLWTGMASRSVNRLDEIAPLIAKASNKSKEDVIELVEAYKSTGLPDSIDSHLWASAHQVERDLASSVYTLQGLAKENAVRTFKQMSKIMRRIGFDVGEQTQLAAAFLTEKNVWEVANKAVGTTRYLKNLDEIGGKARTLSLGMNKAGAMGFQHGVAGAAFQFMSHTTKSLQFITPAHIPFTKKRIPGLEKFANEAISDVEKFKMLGYQLALYGTGGLGLSEAWEWGRNQIDGSISPEFNAIVEEGLLGMAMNMALNLAYTDEFRDIEVSKSLSPLGGSLPWFYQNPAAKIYQWAFISDVPLWEMGGAGIQVLARQARGLAMTYDILANADHLDTPERMGAALLQLGTSLIVESENWQKLRWEAATGRYLSQFGNEGTQADLSELLIKVAFGPPKRAQAELGTLERDLTGIPGGKRQETIDEPFQIRQMARDTFDLVRRTLILTNKNDITIEELELIVERQANRARILLSERELDIYRASLWKDLMNWQTTRTEGAELELIRLLSNIYPMAGDDARQAMFNRLEDLPEFETKREAIEMLDNLMQ